MKASKFSETRVTNGIKVTPDSHFFFDGVGRKRVHHNDGQPQVLRAFGNRHSISGRLTGTVKVTCIAQAPEWFSLRSVGRDGNRHTVYVQSNALVVVDGVETTVGALYAEVNTR